MKVSVDELVESVLAHLDESAEVMEDAVEYGSEAFDLRSLIRDILPEAGERVLLEEEIDEELQEWEPLEGTPGVIRNDHGEGRRVLTLPDDFFRFLYLRMSDWGEPVTELMEKGGALAEFRRMRERERGRFGRFPGNRGLLLVRRDGKRGLEIFGSVAGSRVAEGGYLPRPRIDSEGYMTFPPSLRRRLVEKGVEIINMIRR